MDTDFLTEMAYESLRIAGEANRILMLEIAVLAEQHKSEDEYLGGLLRFIRNLGIPFGQVDRSTCGSGESGRAL